MSAHSYGNPSCRTSLSTILSSYPCDSELAGNINLRLYYGVKDGEQKHRRDERLYPDFGFRSDITSWVTALNLSAWELADDRV